MKVNSKNRVITKPRKFKQLLANRGLLQKWVGEKLGYRDYTFSRIINGHKPLPAAKVRRLAALVGVQEKTIKEIFRAETSDPS